jgi:hypothetical protein
MASEAPGSAGEAPGSAGEAAPRPYSDDVPSHALKGNARANVERILFVIGPVQRIFGDVPSNPLEIHLVTNDVLVIAALPDYSWSIRELGYALCHSSLELTEDCPERSDRGPRCRG